MKKLDMTDYVPTEIDVPDLSSIDLSHNYVVPKVGMTYEVSPDLKRKELHILILHMLDILKLNHHEEYTEIVRDYLVPKHSLTEY
jgi:hypothetical protein